MKKFLITCLAVMCCTMSFADGINIEGIYYILDNTNKTATVMKGDYHDIKSVAIPPKVKHNDTEYIVTGIGDDAFSGCSSLEIVVFPNTVMSIGNQAFCECSSLDILLIPEGVTSIGKSAFQGCSGLTSIKVPESVSSIGRFAFKGCSGLTSVSISEGVENIGDYAFNLCSNLTIITIPRTVTRLGYHPFAFCSNLTSVIVLATNPPALDGNDFGGAKDALLHVPDVQAYANWGGFTVIRNVANYKLDALADIYNAMQGERSSAYLNGLVQNNLNAINNSDDYAVINKNRVEAIGKLKPVISIYKMIKTAELGTLGEKQNGPAVIVIDHDGKDIILYSPKKVQYIKVTDK